MLCFARSLLTPPGQARVLYRQAGLKLGQAATWSALGQLHAFNGNLHGAFKCVKDALALYERLGHTFARAVLLRRLGGLCM